MIVGRGMIVELPKCHGCGEIIEVVYENEYWTFAFDRNTGKYKGELVDIEIRCPNCKAKLRKEFPDGVCNFILNSKQRGK